MAVIVAPDDERNIVITRVCFEADAFFSPVLGLATAAGDGCVVTVRIRLDSGIRLFAGFLAGLRIGISFGYGRRLAAPPKPRVSQPAGGARSLGVQRPRTSLTTAPNANECQSFLSNVVAQSADI
jgi:hypothetical protein